MAPRKPDRPCAEPSKFNGFLMNAGQKAYVQPGEKKKAPRRQAPVKVIEVEDPGMAVAPAAKAPMPPPLQRTKSFIEPLIEISSDSGHVQEDQEETAQDTWNEKTPAMAEKLVDVHPEIPMAQADPIDEAPASTDQSPATPTASLTPSTGSQLPSPIASPSPLSSVLDGKKEMDDDISRSWVTSCAASQTR